MIEVFWMPEIPVGFYRVKGFADYSDIRYWDGHALWVLIFSDCAKGERQMVTRKFRDENAHKTIKFTKSLNRWTSIDMMAPRWRGV